MTNPLIRVWCTIAAISLIIDTSSSCANPGISDPDGKNILFIAIDDLKPMLNTYGVADMGTVMMNNYCQVAVCGPSRVSLLTGLYPDTSRNYLMGTGTAGERWKLGKIRDRIPHMVTLPGYFRDTGGYFTHRIGKIFDYRSCDDGNGQDRAASWTSGQGRRSWVDNPYGEPQWTHYQKPENKASWSQPGSNKKRDQTIDEYFECEDIAYPDGWSNTPQALNILDQLAAGTTGDGKPFFLAVGFDRPHLPFNAPKKYWDLFDRSKFDLPNTNMPIDAPSVADARASYMEGRDGYGPFQDSGNPFENGVHLTDVQAREAIHGYAACVAYVDKLVGDILDRLESHGLMDDTIICLWGDHGFHLGDKNILGKHTNYEQAAVAPLIIASPGDGRFVQGGEARTMSEFVDVFPTLCDLAGLEIPDQCEGVSLMPAMRDPSMQLKETALTQYLYFNPMRIGYAVRDGQYRYVEWRSASLVNDVYVSDAGNVLGRELYDYDQDPADHERRNLINDPAYSVTSQAMATKLENHLNGIIILPPVITSDLADVDVSAGEDITLAIEADRATTYQWHHYGEPIPEANSPTLLLESANLSQAGTYHVVVSNDEGETISQAILVNVIPTVWDGAVDQADKDVMDTARARIEQIRKGDFELILLDPSGNPIQDTATIELVNHEFLFGMAMTYSLNHMIQNRSTFEEVINYAIPRLYNLVTINCHWKFIQPSKGSNPVWYNDWQMNWARNHGFKIRGHALTYLVDGVGPTNTWMPQVQDLDEWWGLVEAHYANVAGKYGDDYMAMDVINEPRTGGVYREEYTWLPDLRDATYSQRYYELANQYFPYTNLNPLDNWFLTPGNANAGLRVTKDLLAQGVQIDSVGTQGHFLYYQKPASKGVTTWKIEEYTMDKIEIGLDELSIAGYPDMEFTITEFSPPSRNNRWYPDDNIEQLSDEEIAAWSRNFFTMAFSKPHIREITSWFCIDEIGGKAMDCGIINKSGQLKPLFHGLRSLVKGEWHTKWQGGLDAEGKAAFRGFYGEYRVSIPGYEPVVVNLLRDSSSSQHVTLFPDPATAIPTDAFLKIIEHAEVVGTTNTRVQVRIGDATGLTKENCTISYSDNLLTWRDSPALDLTSTDWSRSLGEDGNQYVEFIVPRFLNSKLYKFFRILGVGNN
jgi:arylsulfatase A-like enzyme/GH35 family endo-1,4-beta-xylanase